MTKGPAAVVPLDESARRSEVDPFDRVVEALQHNGCRVRRRSSSSVRSTCPAHHDPKPSLVVTWKDNKVVMRCFAGCKTRDVVSSLGLRMADLFSGPAAAPGPKQVIAVYSYCDMDGVIYAEKVRLEPKAFRWRIPAPETREGYRWGLHGIGVSLYNLPSLATNKGIKGAVIITEGEKAADRVATLDRFSTCPPNGASSWDDAWSADLWTLGVRRVVVLADNDQ